MDRTIEVAAALLGSFLRLLWLTVLALPQVAALGLIFYGCWLLDHRLAYIVLGLILLVLTAPKPQPTDRRGQ